MKRAIRFIHSDEGIEIIMRPESIKNLMHLIELLEMAGIEYAEYNGTLSFVYLPLED